MYKRPLGAVSFSDLYEDFVDYVVQIPNALSDA